MAIQWNDPLPVGYQRAANVVVNYDNSHHAFYGRLLACNRCGIAVPEASYTIHDNWHLALDEQLSIPTLI